MEKLKKNKRGRPAKDNKKIHPPRIVIREKTILKIKEIARRKGISQSEVYQAALDSYLSKISLHK